MKETRDILCLFESLNSHEVFTPPKIANDMLDLLPKDVWTDPSLKFLDPCTKSGIFLRDIYFRLFKGLNGKGKFEAHDGRIYDLNDEKERSNHILKNMVYGIATSELTSYVSRRTLYGVMNANSDKQISAMNSLKISLGFEDWPDGEFQDFVKKNIFNEYYDHTLFNVKEYEGLEYEGNIFYPVDEVKYKVKESGDYELEDMYFPFIEDETKHKKICEIKEGKMKFDVVIGNPPYQISDGGNSRSALSIYHKFVIRAKRLSPKHLVMITPSRWFIGGKGLDGFRNEMINDTQIRTIVDFKKASDVFPGVDIAGGVSYFHWEKNTTGKTKVINVDNTGSNPSLRSLNEFDVFIRSNRATSIINKVIEANSSKEYLSSLISPRKPFGLPTNYKPFQGNGGVPCWFTQKIGLKYADLSDVKDNLNILDKWKLLIPKAPIAGQTDFSKSIKFYQNKSIVIARPGEVCTESWIVACAFNSKEEVYSFKSYLFTKTARFLLLQSVISQDVTRKNFRFVPDLKVYNREFNDEYLRAIWKITEDDWELISNNIEDTD